jgi:hypothetical protein
MSPLLARRGAPEFLQVARLNAKVERKRKMVLPDRIELSTSAFIALTLSRPPHAAFVRWTIPSPSILSDH